MKWVCVHCTTIGLFKFRWFSISQLHWSHPTTFIIINNVEWIVTITFKCRLPLKYHTWFSIVSFKPLSRAVKFSSFFFHRKNLNHFYHSWSFCNIGCSLCSQFQKLVYFVIILFSIQMNNPFKVTECVILSKGMAKSNKQRYPWNIYRIKHVKDIVVFLGLKKRAIHICFPALEMRKLLL